MAGGPPLVSDDHVEFRVADPEDALEGVGLLQEVARPRHGLPFVRFPGTGEWRLTIPRPPADRMEYRLEIHHSRDETETICDPHVETTAAGPFGEKSVLEFPGYERPAWLDDDPPEGGIEEIVITSLALQDEVHGVLWRSAGSSARQSLPLLIVHDGPEYAKYASLLEFLDSMVAVGRLPAMRAALLAPSDRTRDYAAWPVWAFALAQEILPNLNKIAPSGRTPKVGMGASLGALAMLHAHRSYPTALGGLYLQSGSYFQPTLDVIESYRELFVPVTRFVGRVLDAPDFRRPIPVTMTAGTAEENLHNNKAMHAALLEQRYDIEWHEQRDAHNWVAWRDTWDPHLVDLLNRVWRTAE